MPSILKHTHTKFCQVDLTFPNLSYFSFCIPSWQVEYLSTSLKAILACCGNRLQRNAGTGPVLLAYTETGTKKGDSIAYSAEIQYSSHSSPTIRRFCMAMIISNASQQANFSKLNVEELGKAKRELTAAPYQVRAMTTVQLD